MAFERSNYDCDYDIFYCWFRLLFDSALFFSSTLEKEEVSLRRRSESGRTAPRWLGLT